ncbi:hypothetical protein [Brachyspira hyodysenteriae]|uniref:hypothetical protein n=2 Tax=Brachyspira hyodysenteriae TaxID=159 RepID=UPI00069C91D4|nr:hypothetical protein [Brachyspira hyodysenteriae]
MKKINIYLNIFLPLVFIIIIIILIILGKQNRIGYIGNISIDSTEKKSNNLQENNSEEYSLNKYTFKILYHSKIFKNSDIYNVFLDKDDAIKKYNFNDIIINGYGSPFGIFYTDKIYNNSETFDIIYTLKIKNSFIMSYILLCILIIILINIFFNYKKPEIFLELYSKYRKYIIILSSIGFIILLIFCFRKQETEISIKPNLLLKTDYGYVYNAKIEYNKNLFYRIYEKSIKIIDFQDNTTLKSYGASFYITNQIDQNLTTNFYYINDNITIVSNDNTNNVYI